MTSTVSYGQIVINEDTSSMSQGLKNGFSIDLEKTNPKGLAKRWAKHLKSMKVKKTKRNKKTKEYFSDNAKLPSISTNTVDIYALFIPIQNGTRLVVHYDLGGAFLNSDLHHSGAAAGSKIIYDFALKIKQDQAQADIEMQAETLKKLKKEMSKFSKEEASFKKTIEDLKKQITKLEGKIKTNKTAQSSKKKEIETQKGKLQNAKEHLDEIK